MKGMINKFLSVSTIFLGITGLIWNVYSYLCMEISHKYDLYDIITTQNSRNILNVMWNTFSVSVIINSSLILLSFLVIPLMINKDIRRCFYIISLVISTLFVIFWEINYRKLLAILTDGGDIITNILRPGYYTYTIVIMAITVILLLLAESKASR